MENADLIFQFLMDDVEIVDAVVNTFHSSLKTNLAPDLGLFDVGHRKKKKRRNYYEETIARYDDHLFKENLCMSRKTCEDLVCAIGHAIPGKPDYLAELHKKVIFTLWVLVKSESFHVAGKRFGFAKSSAYRVFTEIVTVIADLLPTYVKFPNEIQSRKEALIFQRRSHGFPGVVGAVGSCHITIKAPAPTANPTEFYNKNKIHSIILQGTCDHKARFIDVFIGMPGGMHDAEVLRRSELFAKLNNSTSPLLPPHLHLVGDTAYPLMKSLMTPFRDNGRLTIKQKNFNMKLRSSLSVLERGFAMLKDKFKRLEYLDIRTPGIGNKMIAASCVLHNFLIDRNEVDFKNDDGEHEVTSNDEDMDEIAADAEDIPAESKRSRILEILL